MTTLPGIRVPAFARKAVAGSAVLALSLLSACENSASPTAAASGDAKQCLQQLGGLDLQQATIPDLQAAFASGALSSERLTAAYLHRIAAFDGGGPKLNSMRALASDALAQARAADAARRSGAVQGPLAGIPVVLKDNIGTRDLPTTAGSIALANNIPLSEAFITTRLRAAGAIVLGTTNLSEFANWVDLRMPSGYSSLGGQVIAPYDFLASPLGSSSGSAVAAAMALATAAVGSETSGSIISPAIVQSLVGVKPTLGLVSRSGVIPLAHSFDTAGPMTRNVTDAAILLGVLAGVDASDDASPRFVAALDGVVPDYAAALKADALQGARLGVRSIDLLGTTTERFTEALAVLRAQGAEIVTIGDADSLIGLQLTTALAAIPNEFKWYLNRYLAEEAGPYIPVRTLGEIIEYNQDFPEQVKYGQSLLIASNLQSGLALDLVYLAARTAAITPNQLWTDRIIESYDLDAIIGPDSANTTIAAAAGYPNLTVPMGYDGQVPRGLSFAGTAFSEERLLALAYAYEQATKLRRPPQELNPELRAFCPPG